MTRILFGLTLLVVMALGGFFLPQTPDQARNRRGTPLPYPTHVVTTPIIVPPTPVPATKTPMWAPTTVPTIGPPIQASQVPTRTPVPPKAEHHTQPTATPYPTAVLVGEVATRESTVVIPKFLPRTGEALE